jgi:hypothetical protein
MAEVDFDEWIKTFSLSRPKFFVKYEPSDGSIVGLYPEHAVKNELHTVEVDDETAQLINDGKIQLSSCFVDFDSGNFQIAELQVINKIDDVLHRIIEKKWSSFKGEEDLYLTYNLKNTELTFELSSKYNGTKKSSSKQQRKIRWTGSTQMTFLITDYNDPNVIIQVVTMSIDDLIDNSQTVKIDHPLEKFSVYTRRFFPNYTIEIV